MIADREKSQYITKIVNKLNKNDRPEVSLNRKVYRPWGYYDSIDSGIGFHVKRILVNPGAKLSLQKQFTFEL